MKIKGTSFRISCLISTLFLLSHVILQKVRDMNLEGMMSLKIDYYRNYCAMLNAEETNKVEMIEKNAECVIDPSLEFDEQLRTAMQKDFGEEE